MKVENSLFTPTGPLSRDSKTSTGGGDFGAVLAGYLARQPQVEEDIASESARESTRESAYALRSASRAATERGPLQESRKTTARPRPEKRQAPSSGNRDVEDPGEAKTTETERPAGTGAVRKTAGDSEKEPEKPPEEGKTDCPAQAAEDNAMIRPPAGEAAATAGPAQNLCGESPETNGSTAGCLVKELATVAVKELPEEAGTPAMAECAPPQVGPEKAPAVKGSDFPLGGKNCIPAGGASSWQEVMAETFQDETSMEVSSMGEIVPVETTVPEEAKTAMATATATATASTPAEGKALPPAVRPTGPETAVGGAAAQNAEEMLQPSDGTVVADKAEGTPELLPTAETPALHARPAQEKAAEPPAPPATQDQPAVATEAAEQPSGSHPDASTGGNADHNLSHDRTAAPPARGQETADPGAKAAESAFRSTLGEAVGSGGSFEAKASGPAGNLREAAPTQKAVRLPGEEALHAKAAASSTKVVDMDFVSESKERLKVQLEWSQEGVKGMIVTESAQSRSDLSGNMEDLRRRLEQAGVTVLDLDVAMAGQNRQDGGQVDSGRGDNGNGARGSHGQGGNAGAGRPVSENRPPAAGLKLGASVSWIA